MTIRTIFCQKLGKEKEGFSKPPYPGQLGQKIFEHISKEAWQLWIKHQTILINEHHLNVLDPSTRTFLENQMQEFLFEDKTQTPKGFVPPKS
ncbi:MAG TPA: oxidative damage protection protein [Gammaproteobacteria bacterium]|nr:oxidative damage protection protein [Gammaproteobacteria bacterium]